MPKSREAAYSDNDIKRMSRTDLEQAFKTELDYNQHMRNVICGVMHVVCDQFDFLKLYDDKEQAERMHREAADKTLKEIHKPSGN